MLKDWLGVWEREPSYVLLTITRASFMCGTLMLYRTRVWLNWLGM